MLVKNAGKDKMKYIIYDEEHYFADGEVFKSKKDVIERLADFHDIDYTGVKDDGKDTPYKDIWEFLNTLPNDEARLNWLCDYGNWKVEEVPECDHSWVDADNEGIYGQEECRKCGVKKDK